MTIDEAIVPVKDGLDEAVKGFKQMQIILLVLLFVMVVTLSILVIKKA